MSSDAMKAAVMRYRSGSIGSKAPMTIRPGCARSPVSSMNLSAGLDVSAVS